jgi:hypothetical protein
MAIRRTMQAVAWAVVVLAAGACSDGSRGEEASAGYAEAPPAAPAPAMDAPEMDSVAVTGSRLKATDGAGGDAGLVGQQNAEGSFLAYAHDATVRAPAEQIGPRVDAVREACMTRRFGECTVLGASQQAGEYPSGMVQLRAEPKAIQPLVALAADGAELASRSTSAEDLADAVRDNGLRRARLEKQHARLLEFLDRDDLTAESLVALTGQLAQIEAELQYAEQEAAMQERRIRTNLLTINFQTSGVTVETSSIRRAAQNAGNVLDGSVATLITLAVALLPFAIVGAVVLFAARAWLRRRRARGATPKL